MIGLVFVITPKLYISYLIIIEKYESAVISYNIRSKSEIDIGNYLIGLLID